MLEEIMSANSRTTNIRLRDGEYQYGLAKAVASFQLELHFPDVRDIIRRQYGEEKAIDLQFVRKIQTILKKMEKSNILRILPKKKPWELQRYALTSFKFQDSDKNLASFATDQQIAQAQSLLQSTLTQQEVARMNLARFSTLIIIIAASYAVIVWSLVQPVINSVVFVPALSVSILCAIMLGKVLSQQH